MQISLYQTKYNLDVPSHILKDSKLTLVNSQNKYTKKIQNWKGNILTQ